MQYGVPDYMQPGSTGPGVTPLLEFLARFAEKECGNANHGIKVDEEFGDKGREWLAEYQRRRGLAPDGACGPMTRECLHERDGFDFVNEARAASLKKPEAVNRFIERNGGTIEWLAA